jgi:hypothetical protein
MSLPRSSGSRKVKEKRGGGYALCLVTIKATGKETGGRIQHE